MNVRLEDLIKKTKDSVYKLTILVGKRAVELAEGLPALISDKEKGTLRPISLALKEIACGKITCKIVK